MSFVKRSDKKAFFGVVVDKTTTFYRMKGFTEISTSKNAQEYSRKYVDMDHEETDVIGFAESISIAFDQHTDNACHNDIVEIFDREKTGTAAVREIVVVDFTQPVEGQEGYYKARKRSYSVIPSDEGSDTDKYGYSATLKVKGDMIEGTATTKDEWQTAEFTENE